MKAGLLIFLVASVLELASSQTGENAKALRQKLFVTDQYDKKVRSAKDQTNTTGKTLMQLAFDEAMLLVVFVLNVPPTAKVTWRRGHGFKSHPTGW